MTPPPNDHVLNACLARAIGKEVWKVKSRFNIWQLETREEGIWNPLHDANQMEEVEAWLREHPQGSKFLNYEIKWDTFTQLHEVHIYHETRDGHMSALENFGFAKDPDKKRAFALAVWEMENRNNEKIKRKEKAKV